MNPTQHDSDHQELRQDAGPNPASHQHVPAPTRHEHAGKEQQPTESASPTPTQSWGTPDILGLIFDGIVAVATVVGIYFLVVQSGQTEAALNEAREANRLTREAQKADDVESAQRAKREERLTASTEASVEIARLGVEASNKAATENLRAIRESNLIAAEIQRPRLWHQQNDSLENGLTIRPSIRVRVTNDGGSPARFRWFVAAKLWPDLPDGPMPIAMLPFYQLLNAGADSVSFSPNVPPVTEDVLAQMKAGRLRMY